ncbi:MAG TPA: YbaB/EbfC family nucleoid-associated protein [Candidatus Ozemobacteraceae bacterium]|nr:YbaB/EbfC family nucleoid-associated protein [Candidatus Ozemobacteraceae bacterium]
MFKGAPPNMQGLMKQAQKMQEKMQAAQEELKSRTVEESVGGGMITVVFTGAQELKKITINKEVVDPEDIETLQDLVLSAVNAGLKKAQDMMQEEMGKITGGLNIPGLF